MKDEEMAEEWVRTKHNILKDCLSACVRAEHKNEIQAFLAGLKGRPQWHDLRKDLNDLPKMIEDERKISKDVWLHIKNWGSDVGYYDYRKNFWVVRCRQVNLPVLAWCEIPTFDKE